MSSSSGSTVDQSSYQVFTRCEGNWGKKGNWTGVNIAAMVVGFVFFWPIGLALLFWIVSGRNVQELPRVLRRLWSNISGSWSVPFGDQTGSENVVFNEYQSTQYDRIREIKDEIRERSRRFQAFRADKKRQIDEEEFNQFMSSKPVHDAGEN